MISLQLFDIFSLNNNYIQIIIYISLLKKKVVFNYFANCKIFSLRQNTKIIIII